MTEKSQKKNYYFLQTMLEEIPKYETVSFGVYDTLLLREVLFPGDIWKLTEKDAERLHGFRDFSFIRSCAEGKVRNNRMQADNSIENISYDDIYDDIASIYTDYPADELRKIEEKYETELVLANPLAKKLFDKAISEGKKVFLIDESCMPKALLERILKKCGYSGYEELFVSGEMHKAKCTGNLYRHVAEKYELDFKTWLHIGADFHADISVPRSLGMTAGYLRCPRDWFLMERDKAHAKKEAEAGKPITMPPLDDSVEFSKATAKDINERFTLTKAPTSDIAISARDIHMMFNMSKEKVDNLKEYVIRFLKRQLSFKEFWALKGIDLEVRRGEKVALVGLNGSGKSTMLKVVSGVLSPTKGKVSVKGTIAPMIELGAGFDPDLSARENIYLNGAILGYSSKMMDEKYESIIDFAELRDFQDVAIKNFSSGMVARLGFAIATCNVPDILIIDEILSVGDFEFQRKCHKKMEELTENGATVLFVSHSAADVISMCDRALWLDHGNLVANGEAQYIVEKYLN